MQTVLAEARNIEHKCPFKLGKALCVNIMEIRIALPLVESPGEIILPVRSILDLIHLLTGNHRERPRRRWRLHPVLSFQRGEIEGEGLVIVLDLRQIGIGEQLQHNLRTVAKAQFRAAVLASDPSTPIFLLILPGFRITGAGFRLHIVPPCIFHSLARCPDILACHRTCMASYALVQVEDHCYL